jgi:hypothetical protein
LVISQVLKNARHFAVFKQLYFWNPGASCRFAAGPGYPLQFLGFAHANPAGFPLLSLARMKNGIPAIFHL